VLENSFITSYFMRVQNLLYSRLLTRFVAVGELDPSCVRKRHGFECHSLNFRTARDTTRINSDLVVEVISVSV